MNSEIKKAIDTLKSGGVILFPADTGWGLGCDATNQPAIDRLFRIFPDRMLQDYVILLNNPALLERYVKEVPEVAWDLVDLSDTALTIIFSGSKNLPTTLLGEGDQIRIRIIKDEYTQLLLQQLRRPIVYTPVEIHYNEYLSSSDDIPEQLVQQVDHMCLSAANKLYHSRPTAVIQLWPDGRINIITK